VDVWVPLEETERCPPQPLQMVAKRLLRRAKTPVQHARQQEEQATRRDALYKWRSAVTHQMIVDRNVIDEI
jgi:aspartate/methionine/tyrosine aminotransferase